MPTITKNLGHNRLGVNNHAFVVGENVAIRVEYSATATHVWELTKNGKTAKPDETVRTVLSPTLFLLEFRLNDCKSSDTGIYTFTVKDGGTTVTTSFELVCRASLPTIKPASRPAIYDTDKAGGVEIAASVKGIVDGYNWNAYANGDPMGDFTYLPGLNPAAETSKKFTLTQAQAQSLVGQIVMCEVANFYEGDPEGDFASAFAYTGIFGKGAKKMKAVSKFPAEVMPVVSPTNGLPMVLKSKEPFPVHLRILLFKNVDKDVLALNFPDSTGLVDLINGEYILDASVGMDVLTLDFLAGLERMDALLCFPQSGEVIYMGKTEVPVPARLVRVNHDSGYVNAGGTVLKDWKQGENCSVAAITEGTSVIVEWFYSSDNDKSWQLIGTGRELTFKPMFKGALLCRARNKAAVSSTAAIRFSLSALGAGVPKRNGMK